MSRIFAVLGIGVFAAAISTAAIAASSYPPNVYFAFGSAATSNVVKLGKNGTPVGWQCGNFNLVGDAVGLEPSQFRGSGSTAAKMFLALGEYDYDSNSNLTSALQYGDAAVLTFTTPTGSNLSFDFGFDENGNQLPTANFPFSVSRITVSPNNKSMVITMTVHLTNCSVTVTGTYYSSL